MNTPIRVCYRVANNGNSKRKAWRLLSMSSSAKLSNYKTKSKIQCLSHSDTNSAVPQHLNYKVINCLALAPLLFQSTLHLELHLSTWERLISYNYCRISLSLDLNASVARGTDTHKRIVRQDKACSNSARIHNRTSMRILPGYPSLSLSTSVIDFFSAALHVRNLYNYPTLIFHKSM